jgi:hypothetical protein
MYGSPTIQTTMTFSRVQLGSNNLPVDADISDMIHDSNRPADPTTITVTDSTLYRNGTATQSHATAQLHDRGNTVLMSDGSRVDPEVGATLERQSNLRIVPNGPIEAPKVVEVEETPEHAKDAYSKAVMADEATMDNLNVFNNGLSMAAKVAAISEMTTTGALSDGWYTQAAAQLDSNPAAVKGVIDAALTGLDRGYRALCERVGINPEAATAFINKNYADTARSVAMRVLATGDLKSYGPMLRAAKAAGVK